MSEPFTVDAVPLVAEGGARHWRVRFHGEPVGWTRAPEKEVDELNQKHREALARRRKDAGPYAPKEESHARGLEPLPGGLEGDQPAHPRA